MTGRSWSRDSATSSGTGACACIRPSGRESTPRGRRRSRVASGTAWAWRSRRCTPTTGSSCGFPRPTRRRPGTPSCSTPRRSRTSWWRRSGARRCSRAASGSAPRGRCFCLGAAPAPAPLSGSSGSGAPTCCRSRRNTGRSRSSSRPIGSACRTSSTSPVSSS